MFKLKAQHKNGFTLVEVMTALFVIALGLVGVLSLIVQNIQSQNINKGMMIAYQLSQEGIELVRRTRDSNWAASLPWNTNLPYGHYIIDYRDFAPRALIFSGQDYLRQDGSGFYYNAFSSLDSGAVSPYSRTIDLVANPNNPNSMFVRSTITWTERNKVSTYALETLLYDWK